MGMAEKATSTMSGKFTMDDYVDVAARIAQFAAKYPEGSLQSELSLVDGGWLCKALAYRHPDDPRPGVGHAFEPVPGKTPYTRDSEAMNAETSAWGRAIVALGFETKKIASANEMRARQPATDKSAEPPARRAPTKISTEEARELVAWKRRLNINNEAWKDACSGKSATELTPDEAKTLRGKLERYEEKIKETAAT